MSAPSAMDVDETDQGSSSSNVTNQALSMAYANESFLTTLPEPWKTIASNAIPTNNNTTKASMRLDQLEMSSRSHILQLLLLEEEDNNNNGRADKIGPTWRTALDMCHHMVHFACLAKEKQQQSKESEDQEAKEQEESSVSSPYLDMEPRKLPLQLLEDCIDGLTLKESEALWMVYVEPALPKILLGDLFWKSSKACHLQFLKVCNQILHRIQGSSAHYEWKGSLLLAQAKAFDIADRSAIKVWGSFRGNSSHSAKEKMDEEGGEESTSLFESYDEFVADKLEDPLQVEKEYSLYKAFWSLQSDFSNPNSIQIAQYIKKMKLVLEAMESVSQADNNNTNAKNQSDAEDDAILPLSSSENYLTSSTLFSTQLAQKEFQSQFLSQFIIVTNHLSSESPSLGTALSTLYQRSKDLLKNASPDVYHLLCEVLLVQSEVHWRKWKKEQRCAPAAFRTPKRLLETIGVLENGEWEEHSKKRVQFAKEAMKGISRKSAATKQAARQKKLTEDEAWIQQFAPVSKEEVMVACTKLGSFEPTLEEHMEEFIDAFDPDSGIEEEYHPKNDPEFSWRAMRLFAKHKLALLKLCRKPKHLEAMARQWHKDTTGKDLPGEMPESEASDSEDEDDNKSDAGNDKPKHEDKKEGKKEEEEEEEEDGEEGDASQDDDGEVHDDSADRKTTKSEDVEMEEKDGVKDEQSETEQETTNKDVSMKQDNDDEEPSKDLAEEIKDNETTKSEAVDHKDKTEGDKDATMQDTENETAAASNEAAGQKEDVAGKKQETEANENDPAKDTAKDTAVEQVVTSPVKQEAHRQVKAEANSSESIKKEEDTVEKAEDTGGAAAKESSEHVDNGSQQRASSSIEKEEERASYNHRENDTNNSNNKRKHPDNNNTTIEDSSKRPRGGEDGGGGHGRRSRTNSEERSHNNNNNNNNRDRYGGRGGGGGGRRGRSSDDSRTGGRYNDDRPQQHDDQRRGGRDGGRGGGSDGRYDGGNRRDGGGGGGRYDDGPRGGGGRHDGSSRGRNRGGSDRKEDEPTTTRGHGAGDGDGRYNDGPSRGRNRGGGGSDRKEEEKGHGGDRFHHDGPRSRSRGSDRNDDEPTRGGGGGRRDDRFDSGPRRGGGGGGGGGRRDDEGPRGGRGGGRGGPRNNSGGSGGGDRRFDRRQDDRNRGRRGGGGGGRGGGSRR